MGRIISILYVIIIVLVIVDLWKQPIDQTKKLLWTLLVIFFPLLGLILYLIFVKSASKR